MAEEFDLLEYCGFKNILIGLYKGKRTVLYYL